MTFEILPFFETVLFLSFKATLLILAILSVRALIGKRLHPAWRHAMWCLVPLQLVLCVSVPSSWSVYNWLPQRVDLDGSFEAGQASHALGIGSFSGDTTSVPLIPAGAESNNGSDADSGFYETAFATEGDGALETTAATIVPVWIRALLAVWLVGCAVMILIFLRQVLLCRDWMKQAEQVENESAMRLFKDCARRMNVSAWLVIAESRSVSGPLLIGAIRPTLLLPQGLVRSATPRQLRTIFLHELAHLKRWDVWTGWVMAVLLTLHWFNPMLWLAVRKMNDDREEACDAMAIRALDPIERSVYGYALVEIAQHFVTPARTPGLVGISETGKHLTRRIEMIGQNNSWKFHWKALAGSVTLLLGLVLVTDAREPVRMARLDPAMAAQLVAALPGSYLGMEGDDRFGIVIGAPSKDGSYPVTLYEDGLPGNGYDEADDDRYLGSGAVDGKGLVVTVNKKFDGDREEPVEKAVRTLELLVSYIERGENGSDKTASVLLEIEANREWNHIKVVRDLPAPLAISADAAEAPAMRDKPITRLVGSYLGTEGDDRFGIAIGKPSADGAYPITMYEGGLPERGYNPHDDDRYVGTARSRIDADGTTKLEIRLSQKFDGAREKKVEKALAQLTATLRRTDEESNVKGFYLTIPRNREWDAIRVEHAPPKPRVEPLDDPGALTGDYLGWEDDDRIGIRITGTEGKYAITIYENGLPGRGHDPADDDRYEGTARYVKETGRLEIELLKKFDETFEEPVEKALRKLTAVIGTENGKVVLLIPANREWDDVRAEKWTK